MGIVLDQPGKAQGEMVVGRVEEMEGEVFTVPIGHGELDVVSNSAQQAAIQGVGLPHLGQGEQF